MKNTNILDLSKNAFIKFNERHSYELDINNCIYNDIIPKIGCNVIHEDWKSTVSVHKLTPNEDLKHIHSDDTVCYEMSSIEDIEDLNKIRKEVPNKIIADCSEFPAMISHIKSVNIDNIVFKFNANSLIGIDSQESIYLMKDGESPSYYKNHEKAFIYNFRLISRLYDKFIENKYEFIKGILNANIVCRDKGMLIEIELVGIQNDIAKKIYKTLKDCGLLLTLKSLNNTFLYVNLYPVTIKGIDKIDCANLSTFIGIVCETTVNCENTLSSGDKVKFNDLTKSFKEYLKDSRKNLIEDLLNKFKR